MGNASAGGRRKGYAALLRLSKTLFCFNSVFLPVLLQTESSGKKECLLSKIFNGRYLFAYIITAFIQN